MSRFFNTTGVCRPDDHYMLPPERRLPSVERLIEQKLYFVVHAPRQTGKTTALNALAHRLTASGRYTALLTSCETGQSLEADLEGSIQTTLETLRRNARLDLPDELQPPPFDTEVSPRSRLLDLLTRWAQKSPRPLVLFFDEIDALRGDALISVLRQLRSGFTARPGGFPQSVALIGLRDVRDYRLLSRENTDEPAHRLGTSSPFNVKAEAIVLRNFTADEVAELYQQHTAETGQVWEPEATARTFELTLGQPWLVNALARQVVENLVVDRSQPITVESVEAAKEILICRRDTHLDSLLDRLREPSVRRVIEPILAGETLAAEVLNDDVQFALDLGLVRPSSEGLTIANPIYREIVPRALAQNLELSMSLPRSSYLDDRGGLDFERLLDDFRAFWREHAEVYLTQSPYSEAAAQLVFMAFVHKVVNGGGQVDREYAAGRGRLDLCVRWRTPDGTVQRFAVELKVWRRASQLDPVAQGLEQLGGYLARLGLETGTLIVFDARPEAPPLPERMRREERLHGDRRITLLRF